MGGSVGHTSSLKVLLQSWSQVGLRPAVSSLPRKVSGWDFSTDLGPCMGMTVCCGFCLCPYVCDMHHVVLAVVYPHMAELVAL